MRKQEWLKWRLIRSVNSFTSNLICSHKFSISFLHRAFEILLFLFALNLKCIRLIPLFPTNLNSTNVVITITSFVNRQTLKNKTKVRMNSECVQKRRAMTALTPWWKKESLSCDWCVCVKGLQVAQPMTTLVDPDWLSAWSFILNVHKRARRKRRSLVVSRISCRIDFSELLKEQNEVFLGIRGLRSFCCCWWVLFLLESDSQLIIDLLRNLFWSNSQSRGVGITSRGPSNFPVPFHWRFLGFWGFFGNWNLSWGWYRGCRWRGWRGRRQWSHQWQCPRYHWGRRGWNVKSDSKMWKEEQERKERKEVGTKVKDFPLRITVWKGKRSSQIG